MHRTDVIASTPPTLMMGRRGCPPGSAGANLTIQNGDLRFRSSTFVPCGRREAGQRFTPGGSRVVHQGCAPVRVSRRRPVSAFVLARQVGRDGTNRTEGR